MVLFNKKDIARLIGECNDTFRSMPRLIELDLTEGESLVIVGDSHGDVDGVKAIVHQYLGIQNNCQSASLSRKVRLLFLGDYVDRDERDLENLVYILGLAKHYPANVFLLRGNHEENCSNRAYGFIDNLKRLGLDTFYPGFEQIFTRLPLICHVRNQGVFCCHGMIPVMPSIVKLREIVDLPAAARLEQWDEITTQLLWNDPDTTERSSSSKNIRGIGLSVGQEDLEAFMDANQLRLIVRSHQAFPSGYRFFFQRRVLSIFSKPNYGMYRNAASIARVCANGRIDVLSKGDGDEHFTIADTLKLA